MKKPDLRRRLAERVRQIHPQGLRERRRHRRRLRAPGNEQDRARKLREIPKADRPAGTARVPSTVTSTP